MSKGFLIFISVMTAFFGITGWVSATTNLERLGIIGGVIVIAVIVKTLLLLDKWLEGSSSPDVWQ